MEAVIARLNPEADPQTCHIEGCPRPAAFQVVRTRSGGAAKEEFLCEEHGHEFAERAHLVISENA